jgi:hypothetical protein
LLELRAWRQVLEQLQLGREPVLARQPEPLPGLLQEQLRVQPLEPVQALPELEPPQRHWQAAWNSCIRQRKESLKGQVSLPDGFDLSALEVSSHTVKRCKEIYSR